MKFRCLVRPAVWSVCFAASMWLGCEPNVVITIETAPDALHFEVNDQDLLLPPELQSGDDIASLACGDTAPCPPMVEGATYSFSCNDGLCNPDRLELVLPVGEVIDFEQINSELGEIAGHIESIELDFVRYTVLQNDLTVTTEPVELAWGPAQASGFASPGVAPLGRIEQWSLGTNNVELHAGGVAALSDFLVNTSRQIRIFARTYVDLEPGQQLPHGAIAADLQLSITVTGRVL